MTDVGGAICVSSEPGKGTLFEVWWPVELPAVEQPFAPTSSDQRGGALAGKTVLVVDDNSALVDTLVAILEEAGAEPGPCLDPRDALNAVCDDPDAWDLVITDHDMPGMDGVQLTRWLRAVRPSLPVMLLTALPQAYGRRSGDPDLFDAVLGKPASARSLIAAATGAMDAARKRIS
jgi:CheY-like chemotaxis protein